MSHNVINLKTLSSFQKTIKNVVSCSGIGTHSGLPCAITLKPAPQNTGIVFIRTDIEGSPTIPALARYIIDTGYASKIGLSPEKSVGTIEHLMAAFSALLIDNVFVEVTGPEVPIMDGSSAPFIALLKEAGIKDQKAPRKFLEILKTVEVCDKNSVARLSPSSRFSIEFEMHFRGDTFPKQTFSFTHTLENFCLHLASARTFGFFEDAAYLHANGLALGSSLENALVFKDGRPLNEDGLRYEDECVRHKILDVIGDLALAGRPIKGHFYGKSSGHALNHKLLSVLLRDPSAWRLREEGSQMISKSSVKNSYDSSFAFSTQERSSSL